MTIHTTRDPIVPVIAEDVFAARVAQNGASDLLLQRTVDRFGHCGFGAADLPMAFQSLVQWVRTAAPASDLRTGRQGTDGMRPNSPISLLCLVIALLLPASVGAQVTGVALVDRGERIPLRLTGEQVTVGRALAHGLLGGATRDVTRPISDAELAALGRRGMLLHVRLKRPENVVLLRLRARTRATRLAAYVPPGQDDHAFVFLGRARWHRIVVVDLPDNARSAIRRLRAED